MLVAWTKIMVTTVRYGQVGLQLKGKMKKKSFLELIGFATPLSIQKKEKALFLQSSSQSSNFHSGWAVLVISPP